MNEEIINVGLDLGNSQVKVKSNGKCYKFSSLIDSGHDEFSNVKKIKVEYDNTIYSVGIGNANINKQKYFNDKYKIMFLTALSKILSEEITDAKVNVTISLPIDTYKDKELREKIKNYIKSWSIEKIKVDNVQFTIEIIKIDIWVESGLIINDSSYYKTKKIIVCDLGGLTKDSIEYINGAIGKSKTQSTGIIHLKEEIYNIFKKDYAVELDENSKEDLFNCIIGNKSFNLKNKLVSVQKYIKYVENYISDIFDWLEKTYSLDDKEIYFIGGGTILLEKFINSYAESYNIVIPELADEINATSNLAYTDKVLVNL